MKLIVNGGLAALAGIAAPASVLAGLGQYKKKYVVSPEEQPPRGAYPGDDLLPDDEVMLTTMACEIDAPPEKVWPYINQLGQNKAGFIASRLLSILLHSVSTTPTKLWIAGRTL